MSSLSASSGTPPASASLAPSTGTDRTESPSLHDYAMIGDCRTAAMVARDGGIDWLCWPDFDSPALFARLLDRAKGGHFTITLAGLKRSTRRYLPDSAVLETTMESDAGTIRLTDCMTVLPDARHEPNPQPMRELLRVVEVVAGGPTIEVTLDARPFYGKRQARFRFRRHLGWHLHDRHWRYNLLTDFALTQQGGVLHGRVTAKAGDLFHFSFTLDHGSPGILLPIGEKTRERIDVTAEWWRGWCRQCHYDGERREEVMRSAIILRMLTFAQSGAVLAAATTSLPERPQGWMNWDYRYCWPRDSAVTLGAFMHIGLRKEADAFFDWLMRAATTTRPRLTILYDLYGRHHIGERKLDWLAGYRGAKPVRIGNAAAGQHQHDVYGEVMMAINNWVDQFGKPSGTERMLIEGFGRAVSRVWREPDSGIWELRDKPRHYTYSKVMAWYVFDSLVRLAEKGHISDEDIERYKRERAALHEAIERRGYHSGRRCYTAVFDGDTMDASLLLLPRCGYVAYDDPRMLRTWEALRHDLEENGLLRRYPPGFAGSEPNEGAFIICNFWAVSYLNGCGRHDEARERFERLLKLANDVGLYNEAVDPKTGEPLGNMPQAFSHAGFINAAIRMGSHQKPVEAAA